MLGERLCGACLGVARVLNGDVGELERGGVYVVCPFEASGFQVLGGFFFNDTATTEIYTLSLHDALPISTLRPEWVVLENVAGHLTLGGTSVVGSLASMGYDMRWGIVRASDSSAPHKRARWFCLAWNTKSNKTTADSFSEGPQRLRRKRKLEKRQRSEHTSWNDYEFAIRRWEQILGKEAPEPTNDKGIEPAFVEWMMGLPEGWVTGHGLGRTAELKMLGNGVVPMQGELALRLLDV